jgi:hypothetical protein
MIFKKKKKDVLDRVKEEIETDFKHGTSCLTKEYFLSKIMKPGESIGRDRVISKRRRDAKVSS